MYSLAFSMHEVLKVLIPVLALLISKFVTLDIVGNLSEPQLLIHKTGMVATTS